MFLTKIFIKLCYIISIYNTVSNSLPFDNLPFNNFSIANEFQLIQPHNIKLNNIKLDDNQSYHILNVSPLIISNNEMLTVKYYSKEPSNNDWIGIYVCSDKNYCSFDFIKQTVPVKYGWCNYTTTYITDGYGSLNFNMTNLRHNLYVYYFTNGLSNPIVVDSTYDTDNIVRWANPNEQLKIRIVPANKQSDGTFNVVWSGFNSSKPVVKWGFDHLLTNKVYASINSITKSDVCGSPANTIGWFDLGEIYTSIINTSYYESVQNTQSVLKHIYYIVGDELTNNWSQIKKFNLPLTPGNKQRPTRAILYDDLGRGSNDDAFTWNEYGKPAIQLAESVGHLISNTNLDIDIIYHGGDISYATGYLAVWDFFLNMMEPITSSISYLTTVGNHESDQPNSPSYYQGNDSGGECGLTTKIYPMPKPASRNSPWWSYSTGLIHFIGLSSEHNFTQGSEQYEWLKQDLKQVDRSVTPWIIFGAHRAMYINSNYSGSATADIEVSELMVKHLEPLLYKYKVDIGFYGHNHVVQRQSAMLNYQTTQYAEKQINSDNTITYIHYKPPSTVHFIVGTGGASFTKTVYEYDNPNKPEWNELYFYKWGYVLVEAYNESYLDWKWIQSSDNKVLDHVVIIK